VAVLLAGTLVRYFPNLDRHVVAPLARQSRAVDVYLSLSVEGFTSWRDDGNKFVMHPGYQNKTPNEVKDLIAEGIREHGGTAAVISIPEQVILTHKGNDFVDHGRWWDMDAQFKWPQDLHHARNTRGNIAKLYLELFELWNQAKIKEVETNSSYEYVMIFRDDANWLFDFDLDRLLRIGGEVRNHGSAGRAFGQRCEDGGLPRLCDFAVIAERQVAEPFGSFYMVMTDPRSMGVNLNPRSDSVLESERYVYQTVRAFDIRFEQVPTALIPFERCGRLNISGSITPCRHKPNDHTFRGVPKLGAIGLVPHAC